MSWEAGRWGWQDECRCHGSLGETRRPGAGGASGGIRNWGGGQALTHLCGCSYWGRGICSRGPSLRRPMVRTFCFSSDASQGSGQRVQCPLVSSLKPGKSVPDPREVLKMPLMPHHLLWMRRPGRVRRQGRAGRELDPHRGRALPHPQSSTGQSLHL